MRKEMLSARDTVLLDTGTLCVWIRRPSISHTNWWIAFCSSDHAEASAWNVAVETVCRDRKMNPFHQGSWPHAGHQCGNLTHHECEDTTQAWELWMGCSDFALEFPDDPLEDIRACGDPALERLLEAFGEIQKEAERLTEVFH